MSRKQAGKARPGKAEAERKRDERAARRALARERRNRRPQEQEEEEGQGGLAGQLQALGLRLREVPGDGNCLFRALGDQLEGHSRDHLKHRQGTVDYMIKQREDFEPFVEDDVPFEKHVANLAQPGTFAGNDAIVAFARNNQVNIVIHQLNAPLWQIRGTDRSNARELHIAYRYGEHYDSVRKINDNSEAPARLQTEMLCKNESNRREKIRLGKEKEEEQESAEETRDEIEDAVQKVRNATGCLDAGLIAQILETEDYNIESAIFAVFQMNEVKRLHAEEAQEANRQKPLSRPALWEENGSGARIFGSQDVGNNKPHTSPAAGKQANNRQPPLKVSNKQKKEQKRLEKRRRQEGRHRQRVLAGRSNTSDNNKPEADAELQVTLVKTFAALNI